MQQKIPEKEQRKFKETEIGKEQRANMAGCCEAY